MIYDRRIKIWHFVESTVVRIAADYRNAEDVKIVEDILSVNGTTVKFLNDNDVYFGNQIALVLH